MCGVMVEWLGDVLGCVVGYDNYIFRWIICEEFMKLWCKGSFVMYILGFIDDEEEDD